MASSLLPPGYTAYASDRGVAPGFKRPPIVKPRPVKVAPPVQTKPLSDLALAQQQVSTAYDPIIKQLTDAYNQRGAGMAAAINSGAANLAQLMGAYGPAVQQAYNTAAAGESAVNAALAATQQGQGAAAQADLAQRLAATDPATAARISSGQAQDWSGQALANATKGSNNLALLLSEGAHAGEYGAKLPGIGANIGFRALEQNQAQITNDLQAQLDQLAAKEPGAVQDALAQIQTSRAAADKLAFDESLKQLLAGNTITKTKASIVQGNQRNTIAQQNANTAASRAANAKANADRNYTLAQRKAAAAAAAKKQPKPLSPTQARTIVSTASNIADVAYNGGTDAKGNTLKQLSYQDALKELQNEGLLSDPRSAKLAVAALNRRYGPGDRGRPVPPKAQAVWNQTAAAFKPPLSNFPKPKKPHR
jgi:hypothetical protein